MSGPRAGAGALTGLLVLAGAAGLTWQHHAAADDAAQEAADARATLSAHALDRTFDVWRGELLVAAADPVLAEWYRRPHDRAHLREEVEEAMLTLHRGAPGLIDEACLIDISGEEQARQVHGEASHHADLSPDESVNPFFKPTLRLETGDVRHNAPYLSEDSGRWVISNSTPLEVDDELVGLVHFEANLDEIRTQLLDTAGPGRVVQVHDPKSGKVVADTRWTDPLVDQPLRGQKAWPLPEGWKVSSEDLNGASGISKRWVVTVAVEPEESLDIGLALKLLGLLLLASVGYVLMVLRSRVATGEPRAPSGALHDSIGE